MIDFKLFNEKIKEARAKKTQDEYEKFKNGFRVWCSKQKLNETDEDKPKMMFSDETDKAIRIMAETITRYFNNKLNN